MEKYEFGRHPFPRSLFYSVTLKLQDGPTNTDESCARLSCRCVVAGPISRRGARNSARLPLDAVGASGYLLGGITRTSYREEDCGFLRNAPVRP